MLRFNNERFVEIRIHFASSSVCLQWHCKYRKHWHHKAEERPERAACDYHTHNRNTAHREEWDKGVAMTRWQDMALIEELPRVMQSQNCHHRRSRSSQHWLLQCSKSSHNIKTKSVELTGVSKYPVTGSGIKHYVTTKWTAMYLYWP